MTQRTRDVFATGRNITTRVDLTDPGSSFQVAPENPDRTVLILSNSGTGNVGVSTKPLTSTQDGIVLTATVPLLVMTYTLFGPIVCAAWFGTGAAVGGIITRIEQLTEKDPVFAKIARRRIDGPDSQPGEGDCTFGGIGGGFGAE